MANTPAQCIWAELSGCCCELGHEDCPIGTAVKLPDGTIELSEGHGCDDYTSGPNMPEIEEDLPF